jgi:hypothetical protein
MNRPYGKSKVFVRQNWTNFGLEVILLVESLDGKRYMAKPVKFEWEEVRLGQLINEPTFVLEDEYYQDLIDAMHKIGKVIPSESKLEGKLEATNYHLEDLRQLLKLDLEKSNK